MKKFSLYLVLFLGILSVFMLNDASAAASGTTNTGTSGAITDATGSGGEMQMVLCNVLKFVTGGIGKTIASFIIIGVGLTFFTGKATWGIMIGVTLGIAAMFGAPAIISAVTGGKADWCEKSAP